MPMKSRAMLALVLALALATAASGARDWLKELEDIKKGLSFMDVDEFKKDVDRYDAATSEMKFDDNLDAPESASKRETPTCKDTNEDCPGWAGLGECEKNAEYMKVACPKSCDKCPAAGDGAVAGVCQDTNEDCPGWAGLGECEKNPDYMKVACPKSCDMCPASGHEEPGGGGSSSPSARGSDWTIPASAAEEETPAPTPEATPAPTPEDTPAPTPEDTPAPAPEDTPAPTPEDTTPAPATGGGGCKDTNEDCGGWAELGECEKNTDYMKIACPLACKACPEAGTGGGAECKDTNEDCKGWAELGDCEKNPDYMNVACPVACDKCPAPVPAAAAAAAAEEASVPASGASGTTPASGTPDGSGECQDTHGDCKGWAEAGECEKNPDYMGSICPVACDKCDDLPGAAASGPTPAAGSSSSEEEEDAGEAPSRQAAVTEAPEEAPVKEEEEEKKDEAEEGDASTPEPEGDASSSPGAGSEEAGAGGEATPDVAEGGGGSIPSSSSSSGACKDTNEDCGGWAELGECEKNTDYMKIACPVACKACPEVDTGVGAECKDTNEDCKGWAELGECEKNPDYMNVACPVACDKCPTGPSPASLAAAKKAEEEAAAIKSEALAAGKAAAEAETEAAAKPEAGAGEKGDASGEAGKAVRAVLAEVPEQCSTGDQDGDCKGWARNGECEKNAKYMHNKCPVACALCVGAAGDALDVGSGGAIDFNNIGKSYAGVTKDEDAEGAAKSDLVEENDAVAGPVVKRYSGGGGDDVSPMERRSSSSSGSSWRRWLDPLGLGTPSTGRGSYRRGKPRGGSYRNAVPRSMRGPRVAAGGGEHMSFSRASRAELQRSLGAPSLADTLAEVTPRPDLEERHDLLSPKSSGKWKTHPFELSHLLDACHHVKAATAVGPTCDTALEESRDYLPPSDYFRHWELVGRDVAAVRHRAFQGWLRDFQGPFPFVPVEGAGLLDAIIAAARALSAAVEKRTPYAPAEGEASRDWPVAQNLNICGMKAPGWGCVFDDLSRSVREEAAASKSVLRILQLDFGDLKKSIAVGNSLEENRLFRAWLVAEAAYYVFRVRGSVQRQIKEMNYITKGTSFDSHAPAIGVHLSDTVPGDTDDYVAAVRRMRKEYGAATIYLSSESAGKRDEFLEAEGLLGEFHVRYFERPSYDREAMRTYGTIADLQLMKRSHMYVGPAGAQFSRVAYWLCYGKNGFFPPYSFTDGHSLLALPDKGRIPVAPTPEPVPVSEEDDFGGGGGAGFGGSSSRGGRRKSKRGLK